MSHIGRYSHGSIFCVVTWSNFQLHKFVVLSGGGGAHVVSGAGLANQERGSLGNAPAHSRPVDALRGSLDSDVPPAAQTVAHLGFDNASVYSFLYQRGTSYEHTHVNEVLSRPRPL